MLIPIFNGGLNKRLDPSLVPANEAIEYSNIDNTSGVLASARSYTKTDRDATNYIYLFKDTVFSSVNSRDYVEYNNQLYWSEDNGSPAKFGTTQQSLGIEAPVPKPAVDNNGFPIFNDEYSQIQGLYITFEDYVKADFLLNIAQIDGELSSGSVTYRVYVYEDNKCIFHFNEVVAVGNDKAVVFTFKTDHVFKLTKLVGADYKLVAVSSGRQAIDNNQTLGANVTDTITTDKVTAQWTYTYYNELDGTESAPAPLTEEIEFPLAKKARLNNITYSTDPQVTNIRVYRVNDGITEPALAMEIPNVDGVYYDITPTLALTTLLDTFNNVPPPINIKYLIEAYGLFFAANGTSIIWSEPGNPNYFPPANSVNYGFEITGLLAIDIGVLVFGRTKTQILLGTTPEDFRKDKISDTEGCISHKTCKLVNSFPCWVSLKGICTISNSAVDIISYDKLDKISLNVTNCTVQDETYWILVDKKYLLAMDLRFGTVFKEFYFDNFLSDIVTIDDVLYTTVDGKLATLFTGKLLKLRYVSPEFSEGTLTMVKKYNNVYIKYEGEFIIRVLIDSEEVQKINVYANEKFVDLKVPQDKQTGHCIQIDIQGTGKIKEIEYKPMERQNGR